jgi:hypothetical protein
MTTRHHVAIDPATLPADPRKARRRVREALATIAPAPRVRLHAWLPDHTIATTTHRRDPVTLTQALRRTRADAIATFIERE